MNNSQNISNVRNCRIVGNNINLQDKCYSVQDVVDMIQRGEIALSVETIKGVNGGCYSRMPDHETGMEYIGSNTLFDLDGKTVSIPTVTVNGVDWYNFAAILKMLNLYNVNGDVGAFTAGIPSLYKRLFTFAGHGYRRVYVRIEALEDFGISPNKNVIVKKKVNLYTSGITSFHIDLPHLQSYTLRIMNKLKDIDDKIFMGDVYRVLSQLE